VLNKRLARLALLVSALMVLSFGVISVHAQSTSVVNVYSDGDTNITDWLQNIVIPAFTAAYPQYTVNFVNTRGPGDQPIVDRAMAAMQTGGDPQFEVMDEDPRSFPDAMNAGLWLEPTVADIPNMANLLPAATVGPDGVAYRGSQVLLAYNSDAIPAAEVPQTFGELVEWIITHPGQFVYCRPNKGGSGGNFVVRAIFEVSGRDPSKFPLEFDQSVVDQYYPKAMGLLAALNPYIYDNGSYPAGNNISLQLLENGSVNMITAWSDQSIQAIQQGVLPESTKLAQLQDLPFPGSYTSWVIPKNAANLQGAKDFLNFMLTPDMQSSVVDTIGGFPAIKTELLSQEVQNLISTVAPTNLPFWPGGKWEDVRNEQWYAAVAPNVDPNS
jgi:putative spermidine/putrescine transport system substrate-binding protein